MPVVLRIGGFKVSFYASDHPPAHVHVHYAGARVVIELETGTIRDNQGMKPPDVVRAGRLVEQNQEALLAAWAAFDAKRKRKNGLASH